MSKLEFKPIADLHEDEGHVIAVRFSRDNGEILGEPPEISIVSCIDGEFNSSDWDVYAEIDWNPAFELAERIDQLKGGDDE